MVIVGANKNEVQNCLLWSTMGQLESICRHAEEPAVIVLTKMLQGFLVNVY